MSKITGVVVGAVAGVVLMALLAWNVAGAFMFNVTPSPFGVEETAARVQANILATDGWALSGLRKPARGTLAPAEGKQPVLLVEACATKYSKPLLEDDSTKLLSILMPCTITVYQKSDGKVYIGTMNAGLMGQLFGSKVAGIMSQVAADQKKFLVMDPAKPAPALVDVQPGAPAPAGGKEPAGC
jgi:uncharacterized protein (DUF302 family)